jgi:hypothetical protein
MTTEMAKPRTSRRRISESRSQHCQAQANYTTIPRSAVEDAMKHGFPLKVEVLPEPIMLNMAIRGESDKQKCSATEILMSAVTITTPSGNVCMHGVRQIIVEEDIDHPLIGRPVLDEMGFMASQYLDFVWDKFHMQDFGHIGEVLLEMGKQSSAPCQSFYSCPRTFQSLLTTCRMCSHWLRKKS